MNSALLPSSVLDPAAVTLALVHAAGRATLAPSIHNSQPWRFEVHDGRLDVYADRSRGLPIIDPSGRQLAISCGAAIFAARLALAVARYEAVTVLLPERSRPDLLASITVVGRTAGTEEDAARLDRAADVRHTNRRAFGPEPVTEAVTDLLVHGAEIEGARLQPVRTLDDRVMLATLSQRAEAMQTVDRAYRAELLAWTSDNSTREDGIPVTAIPNGAGPAHDEIPMRDFDARGLGQLPADTHSTIGQTLFVLTTANDRPRDWLVAGQALARVLLELTSAGYVASILTQAVEVPSVREQLRVDLQLMGNAHLVLRVGLAEPTPATPRRPAADVVTVRR